MKERTFKIFGSENEDSDVDRWRDGLPPAARARMDQIICYMEIQRDWTKTSYFRPLTAYKGICEIRFIVQNIQYRPLGCYGPGEKEFTILVGAEEKGDRFNPKSAPQLAVKRRKVILENKGYTHEY